jgi:glycine/D-amino acid oxidase-like deaminating enzyme
VAAGREHVVVIGAGVFGAWTAHYLLEAGYRVTLIDAFGPGNALASSGGESRLIRAAYGRDAIYTGMARDSLPEWKALSAAAGLPIFHPAGILFFFATEEPYFVDTIAAHRELGLASEVLSSAEMTRRFPMIDFDGIAVGIFEAEFGALMARRAVQTLVDRFVRGGGEYRTGAVLSPESTHDTLNSVTLSSGVRISGDRFVFALGPWLPKLFPELLRGRIVPTRQEIFFFTPPTGNGRFQQGAMPCWVDFNRGDMFYGFPDLESRGVKFAHDAHGPVVDPDIQSRKPTEAALAEVVEYRDRRFPALRGAALIEARVCQYENSSNGDFLIDIHPRFENVLLLGAGSGHGFKHGPEVGRYAAARLFGDAKEEPRFSLATKGETQNREVH